MRTLILLRHAKSDWSDARLADFDRPLNARGRHAAPRIGEWLREQGLVPDQVFCSAAARATQTWAGVARTLARPVPVRIEKDLYLASPERMLEVMRSAEDDIHCLLLVGHNPGIEQLAYQLASGPPGQTIERMREKFPTGAMAVIDCQIGSWAELREAVGRLRAFVRPKDLR